MNLNKKLLRISLLTACLMLLLTGCGKSSDHEHKWSEITCKDPKTCTICGLTEGEPSPRHKWIEATCTEPAICSVCGLTKDEPLGHEEGDWCEESIATLSEDGENVLRCKYCDEILDSEKTEKFIEASKRGFNFDSAEIIAYLEAGDFCDLSETESYEAGEVVLDTYAVPENEIGIREVDVITKGDKLVSLLIEMKSDDQENFKKVLTYLTEKMPEGTAEKLADDLYANDEILSLSKDDSFALDTQYDGSFYICLSCCDANLTNSVNTADSILRIPLYIDIDFQSNIFLDKYGVDLSLNGEVLCSLEHGEDFSKLLILPFGEYTLLFTGTGEEAVEASKSFTLSDPATVECEIQTHSDEIEFHKYKLLNNVDKTSIEVPDVTGMYLSNAKELLREYGFVFISTDISEWFYDDDDYRVKKQKPSAGKKCAYDKKITLTCEEISEEDATLIRGDSTEEEETESSSEYEKAFVRELSNYDIYYLFDEDTNTVIYFTTDDSSPMEGTYSGNFEDGVTIDWGDYGFTESLTEHADGSATLVDGNGLEWEYMGTVPKW